MLPLKIIDETTTNFPKFNDTGSSLMLKLHPVPEQTEPVNHLEKCITSLTVYLVKIFLLEI
jgi:hypothetical protein